MDKTILNVKIITPSKTLYQGEASSVSSTNSKGKFDILSEHANFISIIEKQPIVVRTLDKKELIFNFSQAIIYTKENKVSIFAEPLG